MRPPTPFESRVYDALRCIPRGRVTTYKDLAAVLGCRSAQAIGQALRRNPFAPDVPCHRVIRTDLTIGGFAGELDGPEVQRKRALLASEGVKFAGDRLADPAALYSFG